MLAHPRPERSPVDRTLTAEQLRGETLRLAVLGVLVLAAAGQWLAIGSLGPVAPAWIGATASLTMSAVAAYGLGRHLPAAAAALLVGVAAAIAVALTAFPAYLVAPWCSLVVFIAGALLGARGSAAATAATALLLFGGDRLAPGLVPADVAVSTLLLCAATALVGWLVARPLQLALDWSWSNYAEAVEQRNLARARQGELARLSKSLDQSYDRLEQFALELDRARRAAQDARQLKARFSAAISHELRTPLNLIIGFCEMMVVSPDRAYGEELPASFRADLDAVYRNAAHLSGLVDDILDLSQIEADRMALHREWVSLARVIEDAVGAVTSLFHRRGLALSVAVPDDLPSLWIDQTRVRQVLINLLGNAARLTEVGSVAVEAGRRGDQVVVSVRDTGPGMAPAVLSHVFDEFYAAGGQRGTSTGLGLAVSKRFAQLHGGDLWAESEPGRGSAFHLALPLAADAAPRVAQSPGADGPQQHLHGHAVPSVVVVDPTGDAAKVFQRYMDDYDVVAAASWSEAGAVARERPLRAVLTASPDDAPPASLPIDVARLPLIACPLRTVRAMAQRLEVAGYMVKPVARDQLSACLRGSVGRPKSVVVVDDDPEMVRLLARMIRSTWRRCAVWTAGDGQAGLALVEEHRPDVVLVDLAMPGLDGYGFIDALRARPEIAGTPVVVVSGQDQAEETVVADRLTVARAGGLSVLDVMRWLRSGISALEPDSAAPAPLPAPPA